MAFVHGKGTALLLNSIDASGFFNTVSTGYGCDTAETTAFGNDSKAYIMGLSYGTLSASGMFEAGTDKIDDTLTAALGGDDAAVVTVCIDGATAGNTVRVLQGDVENYSLETPIADVVAASVDITSDDGIDNGIALSGLAAVTATGNGASQDNGASSANGGVATLHVTANAHNDTSVYKVQHSADDAAWADLATFTTVAATTKTSERILVAAGTTVNRYLRVQRTLNGSGSITFLSAFARR